MPFRTSLCLFTILWSFSTTAATVAFLELRWSDGKLVQLEPNGRFGHVAIKVGRKWLHAHTERGVDMVRDISKYGSRVVYLHNAKVPDPTAWQVNHWLGKPFDISYRWETQGATYCTRLVAERLNIPPREMLFRSDVWERMGSAPVSCPGLSPDDLYEELINRGYTVMNACEEALSDG